MNRALVRLIAAVILFAVLASPLLLSSQSAGPSRAVDPVTITNYEADFDLSAQGQLTATETITARFPAGRHGIFRYWDVADFEDESARYIPRQISVQLNDNPVPVEMSWESGRQFRVAKIGDPAQYLSPGEHTFTISYQIDGTIGPASTGAAGTSWSAEPVGSAFVWQVIAAGWSMAIDQSNITITVPEEPTELACWAGIEADSNRCELTQSSPTEIQISTGELQPHTPVSVGARFASDPPDRLTLAWPVAADPVLGRSNIAVWILGVISLAAFIVGYALDRTAREPKPGYPVWFEPPDDLGPVQTVYVKRESIPTRAVIATLLYLAELRYIAIEQTSRSSWKLDGLVNRDTWKEIDPVSATVARELGLDQPGSEFNADGSAEAGKKLAGLDAKIRRATREWGVASKTVVHAHLEHIWRLLWIAAVIVAVAGVFIGIRSIYLLPFAAFAIGGAGLMTGGVGTRRTGKGRELWSKAGGFWRFLSTDAAQDRFDFSGRTNTYLAYIPYAIAFDCAEAWAEKYEAATGQPAPTPLWYVDNTGVAAPGFFSRGASFSSFEGALASSITAYRSAQASSSSSSGGGFSGGGFSGGGGGGGGGSW